MMMMMSDDDDDDDFVFVVVGVHQSVPVPDVDQPPQCLSLGPERADGGLGLPQETPVLCVPIRG